MPRRDDEDDDYDRPRRRRRDDEDDDDYDRPRRKRSKKKKSSGVNVPLIVGLVAGGVALIVIAWLVSSLIMGKKEFIPGPPMAGGGGGGGQPMQAAGERWVTFGGPGFTAQFPNEGPVASPKYQRQLQMQGAPGQILAREDGRRVFLCYVLDMPGGGANVNPDFLLDQMANGFVTNVPGAVERGRSNIQVSGRPGRQVHISAGGNGCVGQIFVGRDRLFIFTVEGEGNVTPQTDYVAKFFGSLQLT